MTPPTVYLAYAPDGTAMRDDVVRLTANGPVQLVDDRTQVDALKLPDTWDNAVILVLISPGALTDVKLAAYVDGAAGARLPIVPVVPDLSTFSFGTLPPSLALLRSLNARGLQPGNGVQVQEAIRQILGLEARVRMRKVFISYRRVDGEAVAQEIFNFLWSRQCAAFLDSFDIAGGEPVQEVIREELGDKDFVLFLDSPRAPESAWIVEELTFALKHNITVASVRLDPPNKHIVMLGPNPDMDWNQGDPDRLEKVLHLVNRGIGLRDSLDTRMARIATLAQARGLSLVTDPTDRRRFYLTRSGQVVLRVEYEPGSVTLERLHRLSRWFNEPPPCVRAVFVGGDIPVLAPTREALIWARNVLPLDAMTVREVFTLLNTL